MTAIREKRRQDVRIFLVRRIERGHSRDWPAILRHPEQPAGDIAEDDVAVAIPRSADRRRSDLAQRLRGTAGDIQLLEHAAGVERDEPAVRRPDEWRRVNRHLRSVQRPNLQGIHGPQEHANAPIVARSEECEMPSVRRQTDVARGGERERLRDLKADRLAHGRALAIVKERDRTQRGEQQCCNRPRRPRPTGSGRDRSCVEQQIDVADVAKPALRILREAASQQGLSGWRDVIPIRLGGQQCRNRVRR